MSNETDFNDIYGGSYLGAADLTAGPVRRRIERVEVSTLNDKSGGSKRRFVVHLSGISKAALAPRPTIWILPTPLVCSAWTGLKPAPGSALHFRRTAHGIPRS